MDLLISFVNQSFTPELKLGILDTESEEFRWILEGVGESGSGATGLAMCLGNVYVCCQQSDIVVLNRGGLLQRYKPRHIADAHSLVVYQDGLLCASTGTNEVYRLVLDEDGLIVDEEVFWRTDAAGLGYDAVHLNSVAVLAGEVFVSCFGERTPDQMWGEILNGSVSSLTRGLIKDSIEQPHSLTVIDGHLMVCCSLDGNLVSVGSDDKYYGVGGYTRGVASDGEHLYVGSSHRRKLSKSTNKILRGRVGAFESDSSKCKISIIAADSGDIASKIDLSLFAGEVFDILCEPPKYLWEFASPDPLRDRIDSFEWNIVSWLERAEEIAASSPKAREEDLEKAASELATTRSELERNLDQQRVLEETLSQLGVEYKNELATARSELERNLDQQRVLEETLNQLGVEYKNELAMARSELERNLDQQRVLEETLDQLGVEYKNELALVKESNRQAVLMFEQREINQNQKIQKLRHAIEGFLSAPLLEKRRKYAMLRECIGSISDTGA